MKRKSLGTLSVFLVVVMLVFAFSSAGVFAHGNNNTENRSECDFNKHESIEQVVEFLQLLEDWFKDFLEKPFYSITASASANDNTAGGDVYISTNEEAPGDFATTAHKAYPIKDYSKVKLVYARANPGYRFVRWSFPEETQSWCRYSRNGNSVYSVDAENEQIIHVRLAGRQIGKTVTAIFEKTGHNVTATSSPDGAGYVDGIGLYDPNVTVTLTAHPYSAYDFSDWIIPESATEVHKSGTTLTFKAPDTDIAIVAKFIAKTPVNPPVNPPDNPPVNPPDNPPANPPVNPPANPSTTTYTLTYSAIGSGSIALNGTYKSSYAPNEIVIITAIPTDSTKTKFDHWTINGTTPGNGTTNPYTLTMDSSKAVVAYFTDIPKKAEVAKATPPPKTEPKKDDSKKIDVIDEGKVPGAPLPKTGGLPPSLFLGLGGLLSTVGVVFKLKKK